ncbi:MAG TPA: YqaE/Pmp3 family membrane protein [Bacteroidia bacterium]|nr:YqaE/Pmp3 family membrane protein [Bacteroidia bacterium]
MRTSNIILSILAAALFSSCSFFKDIQVEKRRYSNGYYVHVKQDRVTQKENEISSTAKEENNSTMENPSRAEQNIPAFKSAHKVDELPAPPKQQDSYEREFADKARANDQFKPGVTPHKPVHGATENQSTHDSDVELVLLVILAILLPPLAVYLVEGTTSRFWVILILTLLAFFGFVYYLASLLWLIAMIWALVIVLT